jgi:hypothetical protein
LHQSQIPRAADESVQESVGFTSITTPSMGFGLPNAGEPSSYDSMYLAESSSTLTATTFSQPEPFYQAHVASDYFTNHGEPQQVVM